jgi:hypothetical protein
VASTPHEVAGLILARSNINCSMFWARRNISTRQSEIIWLSLSTEVPNGIYLFPRDS